MAAGGSQLEANSVNYLRTRDKMATASFDDNVKLAEQTGRMAAGAAMAGVSGSTVDVLNATAALRASRMKQQQVDNGESMEFDNSRRAAAIYTQATDSMDSSSIMDSLDYNVDVSQRKTEGSLLMAGLSAAFSVPGATKGVAQALQNYSASWGQPKQSSMVLGTQSDGFYTNPMAGG